MGEWILKSALHLLLPRLNEKDGDVSEEEEVNGSQLPFLVDPAWRRL
jgi:hypothetical protein